MFWKRRKKVYIGIIVDIKASQVQIAGFSIKSREHALEKTKQYSKDRPCFAVLLKPQIFHKEVEKGLIAAGIESHKIPMIAHTIRVELVKWANMMEKEHDV